MAEWVAYVDESGSGPGARGGPGRFVLACIVGSPTAIAEINERIRRLKLELVPGLDPADWELHAGDMFHDRGGSPLGSMGTQEQMAVMRKIVGIVCDSDVVTFGIVVKGANMRGKRLTYARVIEHAARLLAERLERLAQGLGEGITLRVVSDNLPERHRLAMERAMPRGSTRRTTGIEFVDSLSSATIQAVDAMAYALNRHAGGDAAFGVMSRNIRRKAWSCREPCVMGKGSERRTE